MPPELSPATLAWTDTHCHLDASEFDTDRAAVRARARAAGVARLVIPAVASAGFEVVQMLAPSGGDGYALGIHPLFVAQEPADGLARLERALTKAWGDPHLVAVGEIGLDHFVPDHDHDRTVQERWYAAQLAIARDAGLPVILHVRRSADTLLKHLRRTRVAGGIVHAFNGSRQQADAFIDLGFKLGFGGAMTFERALQIRRLAAELPIETLVLETDAPDIPPQWLYRTAEARALGATGRNEPGELPRIAQVLAGLRGVPLADLAALLHANARAALPRLGALDFS
jgi:TatD DNase family protein